MLLAGCCIYSQVINGHLHGDWIVLWASCVDHFFLSLLHRPIYRTWIYHYSSTRWACNGKQVVEMPDVFQPSLYDYKITLKNITGLLSAFVLLHSNIPMSKKKRYEWKNAEKCVKKNKNDHRKMIFFHANWTKQWWRCLPVASEIYCP